MGKTITGKGAAICTAIAFITVIVAFTTPNWLETDEKLEKPKLVKMGLWEVCFQGIQDSKQFYDDVRFYGCWWVFEEEYYNIHDIVLPGFFTATQFFFTLCITLLLIGGSLTILYMCCSRAHDKYLLLLWATGAILLLAGLCGTIAVIIFAARGDGHDWMPNWENNRVGWSFALAIVGCVFTNISGILFFAEAITNKTTTQQIIQDMHNLHTTI